MVNGAQAHGRLQPAAAAGASLGVGSPAPAPEPSPAPPDPVRIPWPRPAEDLDVRGRPSVVSVVHVQRPVDLSPYGPVSPSVAGISPFAGSNPATGRVFPEPLDLGLPAAPLNSVAVGPAAGLDRASSESGAEGEGGVGAGNGRRDTMFTCGLPLDLRTRPYCVVLRRFVSDMTEHFFAEYLLARSLPRQRLLMPFAYLAYLCAVVVWLAVSAANRVEHRAGSPLGPASSLSGSSPGVVAVRFAHLACASLCGLCLYLQFRRPRLYARHMEALVTLLFCLMLAVTMANTIDIAKGPVIYYPCMFAVEAVCRVIARLPPRGYLLVVAVSHALLWIAYPVGGVADSFLDFFGQAILTGFLLPSCILGAREDDEKRRDDFAQHQTLRSQVEIVHEEREGLRENNLALREQLLTLQREIMGDGADLESPLGKALAVLDALRSDSRVRYLGQWALQALDGAVTLLLGSGSLMVPDLGRQVQEGTLRLDRDTRRWLFSELATGQSDGRVPSMEANLARSQEAAGTRPLSRKEPRLPAYADPAPSSSLPVQPAAAAGREDGGGAPAAAPGDAQVQMVVNEFRRKSVESAAWRLMPDIDSWEGYDPFQLDRSTGRPLLLTSLAAVEALGLACSLGPSFHLDRFAAFVSHCESRYLDLPYHNRAHAADVVQSMVCVLTRGGVGARLSDEDKLAAILACIIHDYEHPGVNNNFLVSTSAPLALRYNDRSPLESHHASAAWIALRESRHNFLQGMPKAALRELRRTVVDMVLATDMAQHFEVLGNFRKCVAAGALGPATEPLEDRGAPGAGAAAALRSAPASMAVFQRPLAPGGALRPQRPRASSVVVVQPLLMGPLQSDDKRVLLAATMKTCDIGHAAKTLALHTVWSERISVEFMCQGDRERELGIPISPFMDRHNQNFAASQVGFMEFIVLPLMGAVASVFPGVREVVFAGARRNYENWKHKASLSADRGALRDQSGADREASLKSGAGTDHDAV